MKDDQTMDLFEGRERRDAGIEQVLQHNESWLECCVKAAQTFVAWHERFTGEDIRFHCVAMVGYPGHPNAWGGLINSLIKREIIAETGEYVSMTDPRSHARRTAVYRKT